MQELLGLNWVKSPITVVMCLGAFGEKHVHLNENGPTLLLTKCSLGTRFS